MKRLDPENLSLPPDCGGKAAGLLAMSQLGLPVPDTVFIPASLADPLADAGLVKRLESLGWPLIVRSSAAEEDGRQNAFAGLLESVHGVASKPQLAAAIKTCRQSAASERVRTYCQKRNIDLPLRVGVVVQPEADPDLAGVCFSRDPVFPNHELAYVEWVLGHGRRLVNSQALDGKAWLDPAGRIRRADLLAETPLSFLADIAAGLKKFGAGERWDLEFFIRDDQLWWVQRRPATAQPPPDQAEPPVLPWELPGIPAPARRQKLKEAGLFDGWDEYNDRTITPLDYDGFYRQLWEACSDSVSRPDQLLPKAADFVRCKQAVPIAIDPAGPESTRRPEYCQAADLRRLLESAAQRVERLRAELPRLRTAADSHRALVSVFSLYAELTATRLRSMWSWIEAVDRCTSVVGQLIQKSGLKDIDREALVDEVLATVDHETKRMRAGLSRLATAGTNYQPAKEKFLAEFGHFLVEGVPYVRCPDEVLRGLARSAGSEVTPQSAGLLLRLAGRLDNKDSQALDEIVAELGQWFELRESSKTRQEVPYPLILDLQARLSRQLEQAGAIPAGSLELHDLSELAAAVASGRSPVSADMAARRRAIIDWKQSRPWLPAWYGDGVTMESLSAGVATGPARIVLSLDDFGRVRPGDILVTRATNPAWTPLFAKIAGLVVEHASRISHAAIVAREYKIPAVSGFFDASRRLTDGELIEVDGDSGQVRRLAEGE